MLGGMKTRFCQFGFVAVLLAASLSTTGCGGYYVLTVPDQLASTEGEVVPVIRLQRNDFFVMAFPLKYQPMRFRTMTLDATTGESLEQGALRVCRTDKLGYAAVKIPMSDAPIKNKAGRYALSVRLQDVEGEEVGSDAPLYVWDPKKPAVAVDYDMFPASGFGELTEAAVALQAIAKTANIFYLTRHEGNTQQATHSRLARDGLPDGPVLLWQRERWHIAWKESRWLMSDYPEIVVETKLIHQLIGLRAMFPKLQMGICNNGLAAKTFVDAGMGCAIIKNDWLKGSTLTHYASWDDLARRGLVQNEVK
jgi:hypothetical protein